MTAQLITFVILIILGIISLVLGALQCKEKGLLLNNAYLYASEEERKSMNKKPYYQQSGIILCMIASVFFLNAVGVITELYWIFYICIVHIGLIILYAVLTTIRIGKLDKQE